jgi:hypothetical protein
MARRWRGWCPSRRLRGPHRPARWDRRDALAEHRFALSIAYGDAGGALGSLETLLLNLSAMLVGGTITLGVQRAAYARRRRTHVKRTAERMSA